MATAAAETSLAEAQPDQSLPQHPRRRKPHENAADCGPQNTSGSKFRRNGLPRVCATSGCTSSTTIRGVPAAVNSTAVTPAPSPVSPRTPLPLQVSAALPDADVIPGQGSVGGAGEVERLFHVDAGVGESLPPEFGPQLLRPGVEAVRRGCQANSIASPMRRSPRQSTPSNRLDSTSWQRTCTLRIRFRRCRNSCGREKYSRRCMACHWNGVCGLGTKFETFATTSTSRPPRPGRPCPGGRRLPCPAARSLRHAR